MYCSNARGLPLVSRELSALKQASAWAERPHIPDSCFAGWGAANGSAAFDLRTPRRAKRSRAKVPQPRAKETMVSCGEVRGLRSGEGILTRTRGSRSSERGKSSTNHSPANLSKSWSFSIHGTPRVDKASHGVALMVWRETSASWAPWRQASRGIESMSSAPDILSETDRGIVTLCDHGEVPEHKTNRQQPSARFLSEQYAER